MSRNSKSTRKSTGPQSSCSCWIHWRRETLQRPLSVLRELSLGLFIAFHSKDFMISLSTQWNFNDKCTRGRRSRCSVWIGNRKRLWNNICTKVGGSHWHRIEDCEASYKKALLTKSNGKILIGLLLSESSLADSPLKRFSERRLTWESCWI